MCRVCDAYREVQSLEKDKEVQLELPLEGGVFRGETNVYFNGQSPGRSGHGPSLNR